KKVGVELHLQGLEPGLSEPLLEFDGAQFAIAVLAVIIEGLADRNDNPIDQQVEMPGFYEEGPEGVREGGGALPLADQSAQAHVGQGKERAAEQMDGEAAPPTAGFEA